MTTETRPWPDIAIPPGETLNETLEDLGITQAELARRTGRPVQAINEIVRGSKEITPETALQLARVLGVPAHIWVRLEADYRFNKARLEDATRLKNEIPLASGYPYREMAKLGWVGATNDRAERVGELLAFFGVASLRNVQGSWTAEFRKSRKLKRTSKEALIAWLRQGERIAQRANTSAFDIKGLRAAVQDIRSLSKTGPEEFQPKLEALLSKNGVALVLVPHLRGTGAHGATRWLTPEKAIVQMSIRYKWADIFWFSLFHELGHVLLHGRRRVFIELDDGLKDERESQADEFASEQLIPSAKYKSFVADRSIYTQPEVASFAEEVGIAPSIVVGRLQHDGLVPHSYLNGLRTRFEWAQQC